MEEKELWCTFDDYVNSQLLESSLVTWANVRTHIHFDLVIPLEVNYPLKKNDKNTKLYV